MTRKVLEYVYSLQIIFPFASLTVMLNPLRLCMLRIRKL